MEPLKGFKEVQDMTCSVFKKSIDLENVLQGTQVGSFCRKNSVEQFGILPVDGLLCASVSSFIKWR